MCVHGGMQTVQEVVAVVLVLHLRHHHVQSEGADDRIRGDVWLVRPARMRQGVGRKTYDAHSRDTEHNRLVWKEVGAVEEERLKGPAMRAKARFSEGKGRRCAKETAPGVTPPQVWL